jgi:diguanylate cyclase (GGDEF)-like protein/putative nucleotidyltransferase with HDIG domain
MNKLDRYGPFARALFWTLILAAAAVSVVSLFDVASLHMSKLIALATAVFMAVLIARHDLRIHRTTFEVLVKDIIAFWAIIWLGTGGGVLVGAAGSAATCRARRLDARRSMLGVSSDAISIFLVGWAYQFVFGYFQPTKAGAEVLTHEAAGMIAAGTVLISAAHFAVNSTLNLLVLKTIKKAGFRQLVAEAILFPAGSYLLTIGAALVINFTFLQFGIEFGLVLLPIAVIGSVAYYIHRQRLSAKTKEITEASRIHLATVEALATAIDARDQMGFGHVRRSQIFAVALGEVLGLAEVEISALRTGALLHDIGKLAVPDHILNKPGMLTKAEIEKTKIHVSVGASILEKVGFDTPVVPTVKYHHEHWDGTGFPEGLNGEKIPLTARILALVDAYDTLRNARPYRPAVSRSEAIAIIRDGAGTKFDPMLVSAFLANLDRFEAEINRHGLSYKTNRGDDRLNRAAMGSSRQTYVEQIKLANREAFTLYELAKEFSSSLNLSETLELFSEKIREFVHFDTCTVYLKEEKSASAKLAHVSGKHAAVFNGHEIGPGDGVTGRVLATASVARNCDPWPDLKLLRSSVKSDFRWMISAPLLADDKLIGAVSLYSTDLIGYGEEHLRLVETISRIAAEAISNSQRHAEAENNALTDPMTELPNARSLQVQFDREVARAHRTGSTFQILMLDLDGFKQVNDNFGHKVGDRMLVEISSVIRGQLREYDFLARYAGDEFVALIPDTSADSIHELNARIESAVDEFVLELGDATASVGVSIGAATYPYSGRSFDELLIAADKAMYSAKSRRKRKRRAGLLIPRPERPLELDMPAAVDIDDIDTLVEVDDEHILLNTGGQSDGTAQV